MAEPEPEAESDPADVEVLYGEPQHGNRDADRTNDERRLYGEPQHDTVDDHVSPEFDLKRGDELVPEFGDEPDGPILLANDRGFHAGRANRSTERS